MAQVSPEKYQARPTRSTGLIHSGRRQDVQAQQDGQDGDDARGYADEQHGLHHMRTVPVPPELSRSGTVEAKLCVGLEPGLAQRVKPLSVHLRKLPVRHVVMITSNGSAAAQPRTHR